MENITGLKSEMRTIPHTGYFEVYISAITLQGIPENPLVFVGGVYTVIDCIGKNRLPNATFISKELNMTKGAISKITTKLLEKDLIKGAQLENNKKETYYTLTIQGKEAFEIHKKVHEIETEKFEKIFSKYDNEKINIINGFLDDIINEL